MGCGAVNTTNIFRDTSPPIKILVLGFSGAGKTYLVYAWSLGLPNLVTTLPTDGDMFNVEKITLRKPSQWIYLWDIGGKMTYRRRGYFQGSQGLVYVVDSKLSMIEDIIEDLRSLVTDRDLAGLPLLVVANKQECEDCPTPEELKNQLVLHVPLPLVWEVCGIRLNSQKDISYALNLLESLLCKSGIITK